MKNRLFLQLGRAGDVLNVLPLAKLWRDQTGLCPWVLVAEPYLSLLDGATYVQPVPFTGNFEDVAGAWATAERMANFEELQSEIVCTQIYGNAIAGPRSAASFVRESWDKVPGAPAWGSLPLVFDRRDPSRERGVAAGLLQRAGGRPHVVVALSGTSSPFPQAAELVRYLRAKLPEFAIVDVSGYVAPRFYDLLGLLETAHAIVSVDSGLLHLAHAAPATPVVALVTREPSPWHGTAWRPQHRARFYYDEAPEVFARIVEQVRVPSLKLPRIRHAWAHIQNGEPDDETRRRMTFAHQTWVDENVASGHRWERIRLDGPGVRTSASVGDLRPVPFIRDLLDAADAGAQPSDVLAWSNADVSFTPGLTGWALDKTRAHGAAFTHRWDFPRLDLPFRSESEVVRGDWYPGTDAVFVTAAWWRRHRDEYPDLLAGREQGDEVLRQLIKRGGGAEIHGAIYHERHDSFWQTPAAARNAGNLHNRRLARRWFLRTGYGPNDPDWWKIPGRINEL